MSRDADPTPSSTSAHESIGAATRALTDATAALTRLLGKHVTAAVPEVGEAIAESLRETARSLAEASEKVERRSGADRAEDRRAERVARTRTELLAAAARVFAARGYEGASVGDIAAEAGFTKGALYAHFTSKSEVFLALAREQLLACEETPAAVPGVSDDGVDQAAVAQWVRAAQEAPDLLLSLEFVSYGVRHPESRAELAAVQERGLHDLAAQVAAHRTARGRAAGPDGPLEEDWDTALAVLSVANMAALFGLVTGSPHASPETAARLIARLLGD